MADICQHVKLLRFGSSIDSLRVCHQLQLNKLSKALTLKVRLSVGDFLQKRQPAGHRCTGSGLLRREIRLDSADFRTRAIIEMNGLHISRRLVRTLRSGKFRSANVIAAEIMLSFSGRFFFRYALRLRSSSSFVKATGTALTSTDGSLSMLGFLSN